MSRTGTWTAGREAAQRCTDPRDRNVFLGVDGEGDHHVFQTRFDRVVIVDSEAPEIKERHRLGSNTVDDWMDHVDEKRGWRDRHYGLSIVDMIAETVEVTE